MSAPAADLYFKTYTLPLTLRERTLVDALLQNGEMTMDEMSLWLRHYEPGYRGRSEKAVRVHIRVMLHRIRYKLKAAGYTVSSGVGGKLPGGAPAFAAYKVEACTDAVRT